MLYILVVDRPPRVTGRTGSCITAYASPPPPRARSHACLTPRMTYIPGVCPLLALPRCTRFTEKQRSRYRSRNSTVLTLLPVRAKSRFPRIAVYRAPQPSPRPHPTSPLRGKSIDFVVRPCGETDSGRVYPAPFGMITRSCIRSRRPYIILLSPHCYSRACYI